MAFQEKSIKRRAFSLLELSIVLIVIALLVAGMLLIMNLLKQAELNSVIADMRNFQSAYNSFVLRFNAVPGDMRNAESIWPSSSSTPCSVTAGNCNGNGNLVIDVGGPNELWAAWRELSLNNLINYTIAAVPDNLANLSGIPVVGQNVPASKINNAGYEMTAYYISVGGGGNSITTPWGGVSPGTVNAVYIGTPDSYGTLGGGALIAQDAFLIDQKIDDGVLDTNNGFSGAITGSFRCVNGYSTQTCTISNNIYNYTTQLPACVCGLALN